MSTGFRISSREQLITSKRIPPFSSFKIQLQRQNKHRYWKKQRFSMVAKGEYVVKEDGLQFEHSTMEPEQPCSSDEYLLRFRYVRSIGVRFEAEKIHV
jgi:hypothetical protein